MGPSQNLLTEGGNGTGVYMQRLLTMLYYLTTNILAALGFSKHTVHPSSALASTKMLP